MKYFSLLLTTCLVFLLFPKYIFATISLSLSGMEKKDDYFIASVTISGLASTSGCFVQGMFTATPSSYFGYTWSSKGEWIKYISSPDQEYVKTNFVELKNDEPQNILVKPDTEASGYKGPGNYLFKFRRFIQNGNPSDYYSNITQLTLTEPVPTEVITETPNPTPTPTNSPIPTPTQTKTPTPTKTPTRSPSPTKSPTTTPKPTPSLLSSTVSAVLGESTDSASISSIFVQNELTQEPIKRINKPVNYKTPFFIGILISVSSGTLLYFRHRKG